MTWNCTVQPTHINTQTQSHVHKVMGTSSIQPAVSCSCVNITHKTNNTSTGSVQTLLNMYWMEYWVVSNYCGVTLWSFPKSIKYQGWSILTDSFSQLCRISIQRGMDIRTHEYNSFLNSRWKLGNRSQSLKSISRILKNHTSILACFRPIQLAKNAPWINLELRAQHW